MIYQGKRVMKCKLVALFITSIALSLSLKAQQLENNHSEIYIVKEGDTLWELAANLLGDPMLWPQLWSELVQSPPSTPNPHLIYPGDQLTLRWIKDEPRLTYKRKIRLSPHLAASVKLQEKRVPTSIITTKTLATLIPKDLIVNAEQLKGFSRLVNIEANKTRLLVGDTFYAEGLFDENKTYGVYRIGSAFSDPNTDEPLGTELIFIGYSKALNKENDTAITLKAEITPHRLIKSTWEAREGDLIIPVKSEILSKNLTPQFVPQEVNGHIISIQQQLIEAAKWNIVIINKGTRDNIKLGSLFSVLQSKPNRLTDKIIGELMVIKTNEKVSVAIVLHAKSAIRVEDKIQGRLKKH